MNTQPDSLNNLLMIRLYDQQLEAVYASQSNLLGPPKATLLP